VPDRSSQEHLRPEPAAFPSRTCARPRALHVGVFRFTGGMGPFSSVERVWDQVVASLERHYRVTVHRSSDLDLSCSRSAGRLLDTVDLAVLMLPYQRLPAQRRAPLLLLALGSLHKGAPWLVAHRDRLRASDTVVVNSSACLRIFRAIVRGDSLGVELVPLGIDLQIFQPRSDAVAVRRQLRIPPHAKVLVYAGRVSVQKNVHVVIEVLQEVRRAGMDAHLLIVGDPDDFLIPEVSSVPRVRYEDAISAQIEQRGLSRQVRRVAHVSQSDLAAMLSVADAGISLSTFPNENFGLTVVEMQACGVPVVVSDWGGHRDTSAHGGATRHVPTMLSELGPRLSTKVASAHAAALLRRPVGQRDADAVAQSVQRFSLVHFERALCTAVERAIRRAQTTRRDTVAVNDTWLKAMTAQIDADGDLRWTKLDAVQSPWLYRFVLNHAATFVPDVVRWDHVRVDRAFDWSVTDDGAVHSADPRWSACLATASSELNGSERDVMRHVQQTASLGRIDQRHGEQTARAALQELVRKGFVIPGWSMRRARQAMRGWPR
jgi:glycosyltransferase involved in cell wall biosynthesis